MNDNKPSEKYEIIEQALQEAVGGGAFDVCGFSCHIFSKDLCDVDVCSFSPSKSTL